MELVAEVHPVFAWGLAIAAAVVILAGAWRSVVRPGIEMLRNIARFFDDWNGRPGPDGQREPGVRARLDHMETSVREVHHQTHNNGGESLKDIATRTEVKVVGLTQQMQLHLVDAKARDLLLENHATRLAALEQRLQSPPQEEGSL